MFDHSQEKEGVAPLFCINISLIIEFLRTFAVHSG